MVISQDGTVQWAFIKQHAQSSFYLQIHKALCILQRGSLPCIYTSVSEHTHAKTYIQRQKYTHSHTQMLMAATFAVLSTSSVSQQV